MTHSKFGQYVFILVIYVCLLASAANAAVTLVVSPTSATPGGGVTASWSGIATPSSRDWIALFVPGTGDGSYLSWMYVSCSQNPGGGSASGSCLYGLPATTGTYELRLFANDGFNRLATSNSFTVATVVTRTLTVASTNPSTASITVSPNDNNSQASGTTQFTRTYNNNTAVTLTAPAIAGNNNFSAWTGCDSVSGTGGITCNLTMSADKTVTAQYTGNFRNLTVSSSNPSSGVPLTVTPNDANGQNNGSTQFTRTYNLNTPVTLTAPANIGNSTFSSWSGCDSVSGNPASTCNVNMSAEKAVRADYFTPNPTIALSYDGKLRDRVGQNNLTRTADGQADGTFTVTLTGGGNRTITQLRLTNDIGGVWDTIGTTGNWTLGTATGLDTALLNATDDSVNFALTQGGSFKIFSADYNNTEFVVNRTFTLTATFSDASTATASVTIGTTQQYVLTVQSSTPSSGVTITVSPNDATGQGNGGTQFFRTYNINTAITLTAPATAGGNNFNNWSGCDNSAGTTCNVTMTAAKTVTANYLGPNSTLTVASVNPGSGVSVTVSPNDITAQGNGSTQFTRIYATNTAVTLTAPSSLGANNFASWSGCNTVSGTNNTTCNVNLSADKTVTASYTTVPANIVLSFDGKLRDRVGQANLARTADGQADGTFTVTLTGGGTRTLTQLRLTNSIGGVWDTVGTTGNWTLGTATGLDTALLNGTDDSVNFALNTGDSFKIFAADLNNTEFPVGRTFTLTATFSDGSTATANLTIGTFQTFVLTVGSSSPSSGASITVSPNDNSGQGNGSTQFSRIYNNNTVVTLTAASVAGLNNFNSWSGCDNSAGTTCNVTMTAAKTVTANYLGPNSTLTVASINPSSGVSVTVSPNDRTSQGNGSTQFTRVYTTNTPVTVTAPATVGGNNFGSWTGCDSVSNTFTCNVNVNTDRAVTATYVPGNPFTASPPSVAPGTAVTASWNGLTNPTTKDWIGLYVPGTSDSSYKNFIYTNSTSTSGSAAFPVPGNLSNGNYELRLFRNDQFVKWATSNQFAVAALVIVSSNVPSGTNGVAYSQTLTASGGTGNYSWGIVSGTSLPPGLSLSQTTGTISGTPTATGTFNFTVRLQDDNSASTTKPFSLTIISNPSQLTIATNSIPTAVVSVSYNVTLSAAGGNGNYTWSLASGTLLPRGLSLSSGGVISGVPIELGTSTVSFQVNDTASHTATASYAMTVMTSPASSCCNGFTKAFSGYWSFDDGTAFDDSGSRSNGTAVNNPTVGPGKFGQALSFDGSSQYIDLGPVLDPGTGDLSLFAWIKTAQVVQPGGAKILISKLRIEPNVSGGLGGFQLQQNSSNTLSFVLSNGGTTITVNSTGPQINDGAWHFVGLVITRTLQPQSGVIYVDGVPAPGGTGDISSISTSNVASNANLRFGLGDQPNQGLFWTGQIDEVRIFTRRRFSDQEVADMYNPHPSIVSSVLPDGTTNVSYSQALKGSGGTLPYTWSIANGSTPPPGLSLSPTGTLSGTPTTAGTYSFNVVLDDPTNAPPANQSVSVTIRSTAPTLLLSENFSGGLNNWIVVDQGTDQAPSHWYVSSGNDLIQESEIQGGFDFDKDGVFPLDPAKPGTFIYYNGNTSSWQDYELSTNIMGESVQALGVMFRILDGNNYYRFSMDYRRKYRLLVKVVSGTTTILAQDALPFEIGQSYNLRISVLGNRIRVYLDNKLVFDVTDTSFPQGTIAMYCWGNVNSHFRDILVTH